MRMKSQAERVDDAINWIQMLASDALPSTVAATIATTIHIPAGKRDVLLRLVLLPPADDQAAELSVVGLAVLDRVAACVLPAIDAAVKKRGNEDASNVFWKTYDERVACVIVEAKAGDELASWIGCSIDCGAA